MNPLFKKVVWLITISFFVFGLILFSQENGLKEKVPVLSDQTVFKLGVPPEIDAGSALVISLTNGQIYLNKNSLSPQPISSVTKLMTAIIAKENFKPDAVFLVSAQDLQIEGVSGQLKEDEALTLSQLLDLMLIGSSNRAAFVLARNIKIDYFVFLMNQKAKELSMQKTYFVDPAGLSNENVSSSYDLSILSNYIVKNHPDLFEKTKIAQIRFFSLDGTVHEALTTNQIIDKIPNLIGAKTGFDPEIGGSLLTIITFKNQIISSIVLKSRDRFSDMLKLISWIESAL